jgi:hypothetical protein
MMTSKQMIVDVGDRRHDFSANTIDLRVDTPVELSINPMDIPLTDITAQNVQNAQNNTIPEPTENELRAMKKTKWYRNIMIAMAAVCLTGVGVGFMLMWTLREDIQFVGVYLLFSSMIALPVLLMCVTLVMYGNVLCPCWKCCNSREISIH